MIAAETQVIDIKAKKAVGLAHLEANRVEDALRVYASILVEDPRDIDAYLVMGDCYLADGDAETAYMLYKHAYNIQPKDENIQRRMSLARDEADISGREQAENAQELNRLLYSLTGRSFDIREQDLERADRLLVEIATSPQPARMVAGRLAEINALLPALLALNIRQARAEGRPDLAEALEQLLQTLQLEPVEVDALEPVGLGGPLTQDAQAPLDVLSQAERKLRVLFLGSEGGHEKSRMRMVARGLERQGWGVAWRRRAPQNVTADFDVVIAVQPHTDPGLMESLARCSAAGLPIVLDLEADYEQIPVEHADYKTHGLNSVARSKAYASSLLLADAITVPTEGVAASMSDCGYSINVLPNSWEAQTGPIQAMPGIEANPRHTLNLGWLGLPGEEVEVFQIRRIVLRIMREFPQVSLVIGGDPQVFHLFDSLPESRRKYLPAMTQDDLSYLLDQIDILLLPLRNSLYQRTLADDRVMEACIRGVPWLASPAPAFQAWKGAGVFAHTLDEWHTNLRQLIIDPPLRVSLGEAGRRLAEACKIENVIDDWMRLLADTVSSRRLDGHNAEML